MNPGNFKLQEMLVDTLGYIDYWDTINTALGWGVALSFIASFIFVAFAIAMVTEEVRATTKDKSTAISFAATFVILFFIFLGSLIFTPTASVQHSKLTLLTSQMVFDEQACTFVKSLSENNADYSRNVTFPIQCKRKKDIDDE